MGAHIILTGTTGNLGAYLLASLIQSSNVERITCLNRSASAESRQKDSLQERGLVPAPSKESSNTTFPEVVYHTCDFSDAKLGLSSATYESLSNSVTHIVHNAWPVDWNKSFASFEPAIRAVSYLIDLVQSCPQKPRLFFISSSAVAGNWGAVPGSLSKVPEQEIDDWKVARFGYGQSKLVTERLLVDAARKHHIPVSICRVGQVGGPVNHGVHGVWPKQEWLPSLVISSKFMRLLPDSLGPINDIDWVPVDSLATIILELLFCEQDKHLVRHHHIVNPQATPWAELLPALESAFKDEDVKTVSLSAWVQALEESAAELPTEQLMQNPAIKLQSFFDNLREKAVHMPKARAPSLDTKHTVRSSPTLHNLEPVNAAWITLWLRQWGY